jgi:hypothetical protein
MANATTVVPHHVEERKYGAASERKWKGMFAGPLVG